MDLRMAEADVADPHPDIHALFFHYDNLYFQDALGACTLKWCSKRMSQCTGLCIYQADGVCEIRLSEPLLKFRSSSDVKNTLLHEMIHAYLWIKNKNKDHSSDHGSSFQALMNKINSSSVIDHLRPDGGYSITIHHAFRDEVKNCSGHHWMCESCGDLFKQAMNDEPSISDCIEKSGQDAFCGNSSCNWHVHRKSCGGNYKKITEPLGDNENRKSTCDFLESKSEASTHTTGKGAWKDLKETKTRDESDGHTSNTIEIFSPIISEGNKNPGSILPADNLQNIQFDKLRSSRKLNSKLSAVQTDEFGRNYSLRKRRKSSHVRDNEVSKYKSYTVIIKWKNWYANEEEDEHEMEPLHNKRTERRTQQKLLKNPTEVVLDVEPTVDASHVSTVVGGTSASLSKTSLSTEGEDGPSQEDGPSPDHENSQKQEPNNLVEDDKETHQFDLDDGCSCPDVPLANKSIDHPATSQISVNVSDDCRKGNVGGDRDNVVDLTDG